METRRRRGEVGREGSGRTCQKAKEEEGGHGRTREGPQLSGSAQQLRHYPSISGREAPGVTPEGAASRHLLPCVALA